MPTTFMNKALAYLGLKDIEDDGFYAEDYEAPEDHRPLRGAHAPTIEPDYPEPTERPAPAGTVRPLVSADTHDVGSGERQAIVRPLTPNRMTSAKVHVVVPVHFNDVQQIGDLMRQGRPAVVNLERTDRDLARRMVDFCSGLTYGLGGAMERVAEQVFLLTPSNVEVSPEERLRLQEGGLFHS